MKNFIACAICILLVSACQTEPKKQHKYEEDIEVRDPKPQTDNTKKEILTTADAIAIANGFKHWDKVSEIKYTYNIDEDSTHFERSWSWFPKSNKITLTTDKDTISYDRTTTNTINTEADKKFINDKFWLLTPFNLAWDAENFTSKHQVKATAPISGKPMQKLTIVYDTKAGYTPGDAYDFYFEGDFIIKEWVYRHKNQTEPSILISSGNYESFSGIKIAKTHTIHEQAWKLYFTNIEVVTQ